MKRGLFFLIILFLYMMSFVAAEENDVEIHLFYGKGCPHCGAAIEFLDSLDYQNLEVVKHEVYFDEEERELFLKVVQSYGQESFRVPMIFIGENYFIGFNDEIGKYIDKEVNYCFENSCVNPLDDVDERKIVQKLTIPAVISAAIVDAINPCAFAVLIILVSTILASNKRKRALFAGLVFSLAIFISYLLMGAGLYSAIVASEISHTFFLIVAILAILIGLFNLKDYLFYGKWFVMEVPLKWRPKMKSLIKGVTSVPGAFFIGFVVSLFLLPCTSGPYIVILGLLAKVATKGHAFSLLLLYNLIFVLPMILITLAIYFGVTTAEKAEKIRQSKLKILHLIAGLIILLLGIGMLIALKLGVL
jgi:cytochrome c biogenesis protein CcdA/glutaredoxin